MFIFSFQTIEKNNEIKLFQAFSVYIGFRWDRHIKLGKWQFNLTDV